MSAMMTVRVCRVDEVEEGEVRGFSVLGFADPILVTRIAGELIATASICPHEDVSLLAGSVDGDKVTCPGHGYQFDLRSGRCVHDSSLRLHRFAVAVRGDELYIQIM
jgi:toluene monooxygenase system ferredoxin subunit